MERELDALGYSNGEHGQAYIVEIKTKFGEDQFQQFLKTLAAFPKFFPEHADRQVFGMVAVVTMPERCGFVKLVEAQPFSSETPGFQPGEFHFQPTNDSPHPLAPSPRAHGFKSS